MWGLDKMANLSFYVNHLKSELYKHLLVNMHYVSNSDQKKKTNRYLLKPFQWHLSVFIQGKTTKISGKASNFSQMINFRFLKRFGPLLRWLNPVPPPWGQSNFFPFQTLLECSGKLLVATPVTTNLYFIEWNVSCRYIKYLKLFGWTEYFMLITSNITWVFGLMKCFSNKV